VRRFPSTDGVELATYDLGGHGPPLLLAHATGFCAAVLEPLAVALRDRFHCWAYDARGHGDTLAPGPQDWVWSSFAADVLAVVDGLGLEGTAAFGHSGGGAAVLDAEARRPGTFAALWCFEPILWPELTDELVESRRPLVEGTLRRRATFASRAEAYGNFASKPPLASLDPGALHAYVECAFADAGDGDAGIRLRCPPEVEAEIYRQGLLHDGFTRLPRIHCPVTVARGARSSALEEAVVDAQVAALPGGRAETFAALGHFGPMEDPTAVAARIRW